MMLPENWEDMTEEELKAALVQVGYDSDAAGYIAGRMKNDGEDDDTPLM